MVDSPHVTFSRLTGRAFDCSHPHDYQLTYTAPDGISYAPRDAVAVVRYAPPAHQESFREPWIRSSLVLRGDLHLETPANPMAPHALRPAVKSRRGSGPPVAPPTLATAHCTIATSPLKGRSTAVRTSLPRPTHPTLPCTHGHSPLASVRPSSPIGPRHQMALATMTALPTPA